MMPLLITWGAIGFAYWLYHQLSEPFQLGLFGDVIIGLPVCIIFGPIFIISRML